MKKILHYIERISFIIAAIMLVSAIIYTILLWWGISQPFFPLPVYLQAIRILRPTVAIGLYAFFFAMDVLLLLAFIRKKFTWRNTILFLTSIWIAIPLCCVCSGQALIIYPETILDSVKLDHNHFYATTTGGDYMSYYLLKCNERDFECERIFHDGGGRFIGTAALLVDNDKHEIHYFTGSGYGATNLIYTYGPDPHEYKYENYIWLGSTSFSLHSYEKDSNKAFVITKCNREVHTGVPCEILPFRYSTETFEKAEFVSDESEEEIKLLIDDRLIFTYDTVPHCIAEGCMIEQ